MTKLELAILIIKYCEEKGLKRTNITVFDLIEELFKEID
jgi:hypothetical protein